MKMRLLIILASLLLVWSCKTRQVEDELNYMQNIEQLAVETSVRNSKSTIQPGDQLEIYITARDMDVVKPFNRQYSSSEHLASSSGGNVKSGVSGPVVYFVDDNGNIDFNVIGTLSTTGKSLMEFKEELRQDLLRYVKDPTVNVKLLNFKISVLGEVGMQGNIMLPTENGTIVDAIAMAGGINMHGVRDEVMIIRTIDGHVTHGTIDLTDVNFINSPYYYMKQGDAIIVKSNEKKQKIARQNPNLATILTVAGLALSALVVAITLIK